MGFGNCRDLVKIRAIVDGEANLIGGNFMVVDQLTWRRLYAGALTGSRCVGALVR